MPPKWIPDPFVWSNYSEAFRAVAFHEYIWNTARIVFFATAGTLVTASLAAYSFARLRFPLREPLFLLVLSTIMLPSIVTLIPTFIVFRTLGWIDTFMPLIVPLWFGGGAFNIFLFRQFFMTIPLELDEAARIDGASNFRIYWGVILPLSKPVLATIAVFAFIHHWNDFFEPLIYLQSPENWTMAIGLRGFRGLYSTEWNLMMAASTAHDSATLDSVLLCSALFCQRHPNERIGGTMKNGKNLVVDTDIHPAVNRERVQSRLAEPWRTRYAGGNSGPGNLGWWNPMGVERSDVRTENGQTIHGDPALLAELFLDKYEIDYGNLSSRRRLAHGAVAGAGILPRLLSARSMTCSQRSGYRQAPAFALRWRYTHTCRRWLWPKYTAWAAIRSLCRCSCRARRAFPGVSESSIRSTKRRANMGWRLRSIPALKGSGCQGNLTRPAIPPAISSGIRRW